MKTGTQRVAPKPTTPSLSAKIAVIEDDPAALESFGALVESAGYEAALYHSCEEFLASQESPDCLLLDARFERMSGLGLLETLRDQGRELPTVFVMGRFDPMTRTRALRYPTVVDVLDKPVEAAALFAALRTATTPQ